MLEAYDIDYFSDFLRKRCGLSISSEKAYLIESRLKPIATKCNINNVSSFIKHLKESNNESLKKEVTEAMTTNETFFFRDNHPFEVLKNTVLKELEKSRLSSKKLRIWCAAASTGQEPYSIAMILKEEKDFLNNWNVEIVATDINNEVLTRARSGVYSQFEVQRGLPASLLIKYFTKKGTMWQVNPDLSKMVTFKTLNLIDDFSKIGTFDIVFCRNVLIYFEHKTKQQILASIRKQMPDDGYLFLGASETVFSTSDLFKIDLKNKGLYRAF